jgi:microcystin-dependent protein
MQNPFLGQITFYSYSFAPKGWIECAGQILPISQYAALFALLGTAFGGNGTSNFALPDLQGRVPVGIGPLPGGSDYVMGETGGAENVTITTSEMAAHNHTLAASTAQGTVDNPTGAILASPYVGSRSTGVSTGSIYNPGTPNTNLVPASLSLAGGNQPHNNLQPFLVLRPCIALSGVFPARN